VTIGLDKKIKYLNKAAEDLLGYSKEEVIGRKCSDILRHDICEGDCLLEETIETGRAISNFQSAVRNRKGVAIPICTNASLLKDRDGKVIGGVEIIRDISRIKELTEELQGKYSFDRIVGKNHRMQEIYDLLPEVAKTKSTVLIEGESGTGKELVAHSIHQNSPRKDKPFIKLNCAALAEGILESELFGHIKGAFTGAIANKVGRFELADGGTIFLDEIGDMSPSTQSKLLRVLQEEEFERVGDTRRIKVDVRVIAATNKDLRKGIKKGEFREDLYYRLKVFPIVLPPLRERKDDLSLLINHFLARFNREMGRKVLNISPRAMEILLDYNYPGNVRELENIIEHAMVLCSGNTILPEHLPKDIQNIVDRVAGEEDPLSALERELVARVLDQQDWNYKDTARALKISRTTLWRKMKTLGIEKG
jgi:PAS domain S-box-containing protein